MHAPDPRQRTGSTSALGKPLDRKITDDDLMQWAVYTSTGKFGLPEGAKILFHCLSDPTRRARYVSWDGDEAEAADAMLEMPEERLHELLATSRALE